GVQFLDQLAHQLHLVQQQTHDDEPRVVPELLHHQVAPVLLRRSTVVSTSANRRVKRVRLVQVRGLAYVKSPTKVRLPLLVPVLG
ncbi:GSCOCG00010509001-RA-CDS, partial [Cotesia congregata]